MNKNNWDEKKDLTFGPDPAVIDAPLQLHPGTFSAHEASDESIVTCIFYIFLFSLFPPAYIVHT